MPNSLITQGVSRFKVQTRSRRDAACPGSQETPHERSTLKLFLMDWSATARIDTNKVYDNGNNQQHEQPGVRAMIYSIIAQRPMN